MKIPIRKDLNLFLNKKYCLSSNLLKQINFKNQLTPLTTRLEKREEKADYRAGPPHYVAAWVGRKHNEAMSKKFLNGVKCTMMWFLIESSPLASPLLTTSTILYLNKKRKPRDHAKVLCLISIKFI